MSPATTAVSLLLTLASSVPAARAPAPSEAPLPQLAQVSTVYGEEEGRRIEIDIKPGSESNEIAIRSERVIPIAIFGSADLDITLVNPRTIRVSAANKKLVGRSDTRTCRRVDIDADTYDDLVCDVKTAAFRIDPGEIVLILEAETYERRKLKGEGRILIVVD